MQKRDELKFAELMAVLSEVFDDGRQISKIKMDVYYQALCGFEIADVEKAIKGVILKRSTASFPKPAEIIQEIQGSSADVSAIAWMKVVETIRRVGSYQSVMFDDPVIHEVLDFMGGWPSTADWLEDELKWKQKEFERLYSILKVNSRKSIPYLAGSHEIQNTANGYEPTHQVIKIGFDERNMIGDVIA
jgi:hypothetical protein